MSKKFTVSQPTFNVGKEKTFSVAQRFHLDFSDCRIDEYPKSKNDFSAIIRLLSKMSTSSNSRDFVANGHHPLSDKGNGKQSACISEFLRKYRTVYSLDVYHRGSKNGKWRLFYYVDFDDSRLLHILDCFINDHD